MRAAKRALLIFGASIAGALSVWLLLVVLLPSTSIDNAVGAMLIGILIGGVVALVLTSHSTGGPRA